MRFSSNLPTPTWANQLWQEQLICEETTPCLINKPSIYASSRGNAQWPLTEVSNLIGRAKIRRILTSDRHIHHHSSSRAYSNGNGEYRPSPGPLDRTLRDHNSHLSIRVTQTSTSSLVLSKLQAQHGLQSGRNAGLASAARIV